MAIGLRKKMVETPVGPADEIEAEAEARPLHDAEWHDADRDPFMLDDIPDERIAAAPPAARPARPRKPLSAKARRRRAALLAYASYVLLFVTVATLSAAIVLIFA